MAIKKGLLGAALAVLSLVLHQSQHCYVPPVLHAYVPLGSTYAEGAVSIHSVYLLKPKCLCTRKVTMLHVMHLTNDACLPTAVDLCITKGHLC